MVKMIVLLLIGITVGACEKNIHEARGPVNPPLAVASAR
jgi:hypothetical protein